MYRRRSGLIRLGSCALILALVGLSVACTQEAEDTSRQRAAPPDAADDENSPPLNDDDAADDDSTCPNEYCIEEKEDLGSTAGCQTMFEACECVDSYLDFVDIAADQATPITEEELQQEIDEAVSVPPLTEPLPADELRQAILEATNIGFLLDGINDRLLQVTTIRHDETEDYEEREVLFEDGYVGVFKAILLTPKTAGPHPAVIALHGHTSSPEDFRDAFHGREYPARGLAILMLQLRALCGPPHEDEVTRAMLLNGFVFVGLQVYETLLGLKYLLYLSDIDDDRIGLIGHSGGSVVSNLTVRIEPKIRAYVSDLQKNYVEESTDVQYYLYHETVPGLWIYNELINDLGSSATPILAVPYGYTNGMSEIFAFFDEQLQQATLVR